MPVFRVKLSGSSEERLVRASSAAIARRHVVEATALKADEVADAAIAGKTFEVAIEKDDPEPTPADPPAEVDPPATDGEEKNSGGESPPASGGPAGKQK